MKTVFKTTPGPRKNRFEYVILFQEKDILRILDVFPEIIQHLNPQQQTDAVIRKALNINGYCYQYVINKCQEYLSIALEQQPKLNMHNQPHLKTQMIIGISIY